MKVNRCVASALACSVGMATALVLVVARAHPVSEAKAQIAQPSLSNQISTPWTISGTASHNAVLTTNQISTSGVITFVGGSGFIAHYPRPRNARFHAVTDTYFDENGKVIGKETVAHNIDPNYCQPGHRPQDNEPRIAMPLSVRQLVAEAAEVDPTPTETTLPALVPVKYAEVK